MTNLISSIYQVNDFPHDRDEVLMARIKQHPSMKLVTVAQDFKLHERLKAWGIDDRQSLNMYDWLQGALDYKGQGRNYDFRVLPKYDKREMIMAPVTQGKENYVDLKHDGQRFARLDWLPGYVNRTQKRTMYTSNQNVWAKDLFDSRGFLSRRQYFNPDGKLGMELVFHVDGTPVLEISHMADKTMYRLLGNHGLPNWLLANELSLMLWWYGQIVKPDTVVYNDDPLLDPVWTQLDDRLKLIEVAHAQDLSNDRVAQLQSREHVMAINPDVARVYHYDYLNPWQPVGKVHGDKMYDKKKVAGVGRWLTNQMVDKLVGTIKLVHDENPDVKFDLLGYFTTDSQKYYQERMKNLKLLDIVNVRGNLVGEARKKFIQQAAVAFVIQTTVDSSVLPAMINHAGVPVVTNVSGFRGAYVTSESAKLFAQGINIGLKQEKLWHKDVKAHAK